MTLNFKQSKELESVLLKRQAEIFAALQQVQAHLRELERAECPVPRTGDSMGHRLASPQLRRAA